MSDARLRELARRFRSTGAVEDEAAWLRGQVRVGALDRDQVELAAYLLSDAARLAIGEDAWVDLTLAVKARVPGHDRARSMSQSLRIWIQGLDRASILERTHELLVSGEVKGSLEVLPYTVRGGEFKDELAYLEVRQALGEDLYPWILGTGDPVRARVEARRAEP